MEVKVIDYLKHPPSYAQLKDILVKLNMKPEEIIRKGESIYKQKFKDKKFGFEEWIKIMTECPILIERPIVVKGNRAVLGRPIENINSLIC